MLYRRINRKIFFYQCAVGGQWPSDRVLDSRQKGRGFEPHRLQDVVSFSKNINPSLVLVQPRKTCSCITERLLMGCKESNQTQNRCAVKHLNLEGIFIWPYGSKNKLPKYETVKYCYEFSYTISNRWMHTISLLV